MTVWKGDGMGRDAPSTRGESTGSAWFGIRRGFVEFQPKKPAAAFLATGPFSRNPAGMRGGILSATHPYCHSRMLPRIPAGLRLNGPATRGLGFRLNLVAEFATEVDPLRPERGRRQWREGGDGGGKGAREIEVQELGHIRRATNLLRS